MSDFIITDSAEYGCHVALLCVNHPGKRWYTKNIGHIGARSIFASQEQYGVKDGRLVNLYECDCPQSDLRLVESYEAKISVE